MTRLQSATDTLKELVILVVVLGGLASFGYWIFEGKTPWDAVWWMVASGTTVGYGDQFPVTVGGRIVAIVFITLMVLFVTPLITARISAHLIVDDNAWTAEEQEQVKNDLIAIKKKLGIND